jgi:hypothetical protein
VAYPKPERSGGQLDVWLELNDHRADGRERAAQAASDAAAYAACGAACAAAAAYAACAADAADAAVANAADAACADVAAAIACRRRHRSLPLERRCYRSQRREAAEDRR